MHPRGLLDRSDVVAGGIVGVDLGTEVPEVGVAHADANRLGQLRGRSPEMMRFAKKAMVTMPWPTGPEGMALPVMGSPP